ncbi:MULTISPECIES: hypothetical protein [Brevibacillus]|uniref:Uncharacterized protein n=1 Tax=Brevibacillus parabrevis TaxID=54914 RepID=A0A4Y3PJL2_BREPA|nr:MULTISPECIES: hypothetical protein [Brevibacillus]MDH6349587.1 hypothetical protein [Brevibacillus sp. 1238]NRQ54583.1 hypothetical protein [Brevibacillus sp. HD1.4A]GEB34690.1 hypothetical protein BPA01_42700 [Brevibacillus parabrevis]
MLYFLIAVAATFLAAFFFTGSVSLRARDKHAVHHYSDDAYAHQTMHHLQQHNNNPF